MTVAVEIDDRIAKCRKILETDPNSQIFAALAEAYRKKGELDKAFRLCQGGLRIHPSYGSAHVVMAKINLDRGLYDWAEAEVNKAVEIDGRSRAIDLLLAEIFLFKGEYKRSIKLLNRLLQIDPENGQIRKLLDIALKIPEEQAAQIGSPVSESIEETRITTAGSLEAVAEPAPEKEPVFGTHEILRQAVTIPKMQGAQFINHEGLVIDSEWSVKIDATTCGAALAEVDQFLNLELVKASFGHVKFVLIETAEYVFYLLEVRDGMFLFVGDEKINLGTMRMKISTLVDGYQGDG
ncbi:MAG: hypothetical protein GY867_06435 [bacterium]|nr:hypothetical protein [bacterium]